MRCCIVLCCKYPRYSSSDLVSSASRSFNSIALRLPDSVRHHGGPFASALPISISAQTGRSPLLAHNATYAYKTTQILAASVGQRHDQLGRRRPQTRVSKGIAYQRGAKSKITLERNGNHGSIVFFSGMGHSCFRIRTVCQMLIQTRGYPRTSLYAM